MTKKIVLRFFSFFMVLSLIFTGCASPVNKDVEESITENIETTESTTETTTESTTTTTTTTEAITNEEIAEEELDDLQKIIHTVAKRYGATAIQVATIKDGVVSKTAEYGWAVKGERKIEPDTKIRVASLSKTIVAMVVFKLVEEGKLDIDEDISVYLGVNVRHPSYPNIPITLRMLLTHTSGINNQGYQNSLEKVQEYLLKSSSYVEKPGTYYRYNNYGFGLVATICECVTGKSLNNLAKEYFFEPMGIEASFLAGQLDASKLAAIYESDGTVGLSIERQISAKNDTNKVASYMGYYAGGLTISAQDLAKIMTMLMNYGVYNGQQFLSRESVELMQTPQLSFNTIQCMPVRKKRGIFQQDYMYYHTGSAYGVYSLYSYNPDTKIGVVVFTTGAWRSKDRYNVYSVCGNIAEGIITKNLL